MRAAGLTSVLTDVAPSDKVPGAAEKLALSMLTLFFSWARQLVKKGQAGSMFSDSLDNLEREAYDEVKSGSYYKYDIHVACGRKALA